MIHLNVDGGHSRRAKARQGVRSRGGRRRGGLPRSSHKWKDEITRLAKSNQSAKVKEKEQAGQQDGKSAARGASAAGIAGSDRRLRYVLMLPSDYNT